MEKIMLLDNDLVSATPLGGNIDVDKMRYCIVDAQISRIEEILGSELYEKMRDDFPNYASGSIYEELYGFIKPILVHQSAREYILTGAYSVNNAGIFKAAPTNATPVEKEEVDALSKNQERKADMYAERLERWLCKKSGQIPEYKCSPTNNVNPVRNSQYGDWSF